MVTGTGRSRRELLAAFVPALTLDLDLDAGSRHASVDGSMLSADISGFTALSERQSAKGAPGAEELAEIMSACFTDLIDAADEHGGDVVKFGGDALLIIFRGDRHRHRAAHGAAALQRALAASRAARRSGLTMSVGVATGPFDVFTVGRRRRELLVAGSAADRVITLESDAGPGEILVDQGIAEVLDTDCIIARDGAAVSIAVDTGSSDVSSNLRRSTPSADADLERLVPPPVVAQLDAFAQLGGEHRSATVGFLAVDGLGALISRDPDEAARELGGIVDAVSQACRRRGVAPLETDIAVDGFKFVLSAGAPVTRGNDSDALLSAALEILEHDTPLGLRIGAQRGRVFAGFIGHPDRWTYSMTGDCMSTAARMAAKADDRSIIAVQDAVAASRAPFASTELDPFTVKGKSEPIRAHLVTGVDHERFSSESDTSLLVGRDDAIDRCVTLLDDAPSRLDIVGAPGAGATSVLHTALARSRYERVLGCRPRRDAAEPYATLRQPIRTLLGLPAVGEASPTDVGDVLIAAIGRFAPPLVDLAPLVADVVGADAGSTDRADAIGESFRRARTVDAVTELLGSISDDAWTVLAVDDAHWLDESSAELLSALHQSATTSFAVATASRPGGAWNPPDPARLVALDPLPDDAIRTIAIERSERALSDPDLAAIISRSDGNPLFASELARSLGSNSSDTELPDSIERLIASRIDELSPPARRTLRLAAVIGDDVEVETLRAMLGASDDATVTDTLTNDLAGVMVETSGGWNFAQSIHRDVAYSGLPYRERRRLHALVGERIESTIRTGIGEHAARLSLHWMGAGQFERAWTFSVLAGDRATELSSPGDAIVAYRRALDAASRTRAVTRRQRAHIAARLGDVAEVAGRYDVAATAYQRARRTLPADDPDQVPLFRKLGVVHERGGRYDRAVSWYQRGLDAADRLDHAAAAEPRELQAATAGIRFRQGRHDEARMLATAVADDIATPHIIRLRACSVAHLALQYLGRRDERDHYGALGLELAELTDDPILEANLANNLGIAAYYDGDWERAAELYGDALERREAAGDLIGAVTSLINLGEVRSDQRRFSEARRLLDDALRRATAAEYEIAIHVARGNLGRLAHREGDLDRAREMLRDAHDAFAEMDATAFVLETQVRRFDVDLPPVTDLLQLLADNETAGGGATITVPCLRLLARRLRLDGELDQAATRMDEAIRLGRAERLDAEVTWCLDELETIEQAAGRNGSQANAEASADRRRLGIVDV